jgi:hypothetical protein
MTGTRRGLRALVDTGYMHFDKDKPERSAAQGCPLCLAITGMARRIYWHHSTNAVAHTA